ncbi:TrmH family RNA methyltransferase [Faecalibacter bovis]|uniref:RNA methyltransferase n=1 Tax=Faecalibacter bovis TaxID=2898187 RepID=A0ABX7XFV9_9FLAO|nr:RNA methyltransferase [Faecalibacter bovis]MBS7332591.1 RNA methyltransferase [Weeksellaceae bacterium]QTV06779.1 RNA methyltransferase [Faecalibacter bovis]
MQIESLQNQKIKNLLKLQDKSRERKNQGLFIVEGTQENELAIKGGYEAVEIYICEDIYDANIKFDNPRRFEITRAIFEKIAYRKSTGGIIGVYKTKASKLEDLNLPENPLVVVLEAVEKPGNLGAVLRTGDGAKVDAVIVCDETVDFFNPNVIRSSVGTLFTNQIASASKEDVLDYLKNKNVQIISTFLRDETISLYEADFTSGSAIILGTEATGLSDFWADNSAALIKIPMLGFVDSLNVSNAAAICVYEAVRQRQ